MKITTFQLKHSVNRSHRPLVLLLIALAFTPLVPSPATHPHYPQIRDALHNTVNPDLVARDEQGKPYTVRYDAVNAMLLNEFLKAHRKVERLESSVAKQQMAAANKRRRSRS